MLITNTVWVSPLRGKLKAELPEVFATEIAEAEDGFVKVIAWFVLNGWFGR